MNAQPETHPGTESAWERRAGETSKAYTAFRVFRDLPAAQRSAAAVAQQVGLRDRRCQELAARWDWWGRADAWDDACHEVEDQERLDAIRSMHAVHRQAGRAAIVTAIQALRLVKPEDMPVTTIARLMELGAKLERSTLLVSVEELQGIEVEEDAIEDPWERIARELDPHIGADL